ncbi:MAG: hypothetical protein IH905_11270 [Proteobacteria bacterium]|nr:hypothetical protein [Pseudomonadota bacterium]
MKKFQLPADPKAYLDEATIWSQGPDTIGREWAAARADPDFPQMFKNDQPAGPLRASDVRELFRNDWFRAGVIATAIWGYPSRMRGRVTATLRQADAIGLILAALRQTAPLPAKTHLAVVRGFHQIGTSTATKLLFMADVESNEGPNLIYDERVAVAIGRIGSDLEFKQLSGRAAAAIAAKNIQAFQEQSYPEYVIAANAAASRLGVTPLQIEKFLFDKGEDPGRG